MRETLCVKMVDSIDDGHEWFVDFVEIGGERLMIALRKATPEECDEKV